MRTRVAEYDIRSRKPIFGMEGYDQLVVLVRDRERPLGVATIPTGRKHAVLGRADIERHISGWLPSGAYTLRDEPIIRAGATPEISVVVCTKDRPNPLGRCLAALRRVHYAPFEILVVDNASSDDATAKVAAKHGARLVREERPGLDRARNRGIREARFDVIAFVDDDVQVDPGWLSAVGRAFSDPQIDAMTGLVLPLELETTAQAYFELYGNGMSKGFRSKVFGPSPTSRDLIAVQHIGVGANMAARRSALQAVGCFDPALDVGSPAAGAGDLDMFHRLLAAGKRIRYEPLAMAWHQHRRDIESLTTQIYNNGRSFGVYLLKVIRDGTAPRRAVLSYATWTWGRWLFGRLVRGTLGRHVLPTKLLWAEVRGALGSPFVFLATYRWSRGIPEEDVGQCNPGIRMSIEPSQREPTAT